MNITIIGLIAGSFTTASFVPQAVKALKTKETKSLSLGTFSFLLLSAILWTIYGVTLKDMPLIIFNSISLILNIIIIILKLKYR